MSGQCSAERREILVAILRYLKALARAGDVSGLQEMGIEKPQEILEVLGLPDVLELPAANQSLFSIQIHPDALINWARYVKENYRDVEAMYLLIQMDASLPHVESYYAIPHHDFQELRLALGVPSSKGGRTAPLTGDLHEQVRGYCREKGSPETPWDWITLGNTITPAQPLRKIFASVMRIRREGVCESVLGTRSEGRG